MAETANLKDAGNGDFCRLLREFDLVLPWSVGAALGGELINAAEGGLVESGCELGSDAPHRNRRVLILEAVDDVLIQVVAGQDGGLRKSPARRRRTSPNCGRGCRG